MFAFMKQAVLTIFEEKANNNHLNLLTSHWCAVFLINATGVDKQLN